MLPYPVRQSHFFRDVFSEDDADFRPPIADHPIANVRETFQASWALGQLDSIIASGSWLHGRGELGRAEAIRFSRALNIMGLHGQALSILSDERYSSDHSRQYWGSLADAFAGVGDLDRAADALAQAVAMGEGDSPPKAPLAEALSRARRAALAGGGPSSWTEVAALVRSYLVLDLPASGAEALCAALGESPPWSDDEVIEALVLAQDVLRFAQAALADRFIVSMSEHLQRLGLLHGDDGTAPSGPNTTADRSTTRSVREPAAELFLALADARQGRHQVASARLGPLASRITGEDVRGAETARLDLARSVGRILIEEVKPRFQAGGPSKIIDMFCFSDEFTLLTIKLEEMYDWVDHFVIVEAPFTFRGDPKPLHFAQSKAQFARFADKIVHVTVDSLPEGLQNPWGRAFYQRDCGLRALPELCGEDDIVLISDVDEVIDRNVMRSFSGPFASLGMRYYSYFFNLERIEPRQSIWAVVARAKYLQQIGASYARFGLPHYAKAYYLDDAGWHFSKVRSAEGLARKFSRNCNIVRAAVDQDTLSKTISQVRADGGLEGFVRRELDDGFPEYIRRHADDLREFVL